MTTLHLAPAHCASPCLNSANDVAPEHDLVATPLACGECRRPCVFALRGDASIVEMLREMRCPHPDCRMPGALKLAPKEAA